MKKMAKPTTGSFIYQYMVYVLSKTKQPMSPTEIANELSNVGYVSRAEKTRLLYIVNASLIKYKQFFNRISRGQYLLSTEAIKAIGNDNVVASCLKVSNPTVLDRDQVLKRGLSNAKYLLDYVTFVLAKKNKPMTPSQIAEQVLMLGWKPHSNRHEVPISAMTWQTLRERYDMFVQVARGQYALNTKKLKRREKPIHRYIHEMNPRSMGPAAIWNALKDKGIWTTYSSVREAIRQKFKIVNGRYVYK